MKTETSLYLQTGLVVGKCYSRRMLQKALCKIYDPREVISRLNALEKCKDVEVVQKCPLQSFSNDTIQINRNFLL